MKKIILIQLLLSSIFIISCDNTKYANVKKKAVVSRVGPDFNDGTTRINYFLVGDYKYEMNKIYMPTSIKPKVGDTISVIVKVPISEIK